MKNENIYFIEGLKLLSLPDVPLIFDLFGIYSDNLFIVGGSIRDILLNKFNQKNYDIDFSFNAPVLSVYEYLKNRLILKKYSSIFINDNLLNYGVISLIIKNKKYDFTMFRNDYYKNNLRYPIVSYTNNIITDAKRRDFTINAIYLNKHGKLFDPTEQGLLDIKNKVIRFIKDDKKDINNELCIIRRITEDPIRIIRYIRFYKKIFPEFIVNDVFNASNTSDIINFCKILLTRIIGYDYKDITTLLDNLELLKFVGFNKLKSEISKI